ncbi:MAG: PRD domain-containing protein [Eubacteriales bacterium]|nr:PRD domain-containing protein [Eubacteriales bacterium]
MVVIKKVLNSSVVLVNNENNEEFILLGKGIGYGKKTGDTLDADEHDQMFVPVEQTRSHQLQEFVEEIPIEILQVTQEIVLEAAKILDTELSKNLYFVLADHINFAIERMRNGIKITNRVFWEIKTYYPDEFNVGLLAINKVEQRLGIRLPEEEAANCAFHFANAESNSESGYDTIKFAKVISEIINIVVFSINRTLDKKSIHYTRFITHIKFFVERYFTGRMLSGNEDFGFDTKKYPKETLIAEKIQHFLEEKYGIPLSKEELVYLTIHITILSR